VKSALWNRRRVASSAFAKKHTNFTTITGQPPVDIIAADRTGLCILGPKPARSQVVGSYPTCGGQVGAKTTKSMADSGLKS